MKIGKAKSPGIAGYTPPRKKGDPLPEGHGFVRPTLYRPEYCQSLVEYFAQPTSWEINYDLKNSGKVLPHSKLPTFERWCYETGIAYETAYTRWREANPEFKEAWETAKNLQKAFLLELGAAGIANHVTALMLRTGHGMKDEEKEDDSNKPLEIRIIKAVKPGSE